MRARLRATVILGGLLIASAASAAAVIDDFAGGFGEYRADPPFVNVNIGGSPYQRLLSGDVLNSTNRVDLRVFGASGLYIHAADADATSFSSIEYLLNGVDLRLESNALRVVIPSANYGSAVALGVDGISISVPIPAGGMTVDFLFSDFVGADLQNVPSLLFRVDGSQTRGVNLTVDSISIVCTSAVATGEAGADAPELCKGSNGTVPEPATLTLLVFGLAGLAASRRRKQ